MDGSTISAHAALVQLMVMVSASDREMSDSELKTMGGIVSYMPIFQGYDPDKLVSDAETCAEILGEDEGVETVLGLLRKPCQRNTAIRPTRSPATSRLPIPICRRKS